MFPALQDWDAALADLAAAAEAEPGKNPETLKPYTILTAGLGCGAGGPGGSGGGGAGGRGRARGAGARAQAARGRAAARARGLQAHVLLARVLSRVQVPRPNAAQQRECATCERRSHAGSKNELRQE